MGEVPAAGRAQGQDQVAQALLPEERPRRRARLGGAVGVEQQDVALGERHLALAVEHPGEGADHAGLHVQGVHERARAHEQRRGVSGRAVAQRAGDEVRDAHEEGREGLQAREAQQEVVEGAHHPGGRQPLPRVGAQGRPEGRGDARGLDALAAHVTHDHAGPAPRQADQVVEVAADEGLGRRRGVGAVRGEALDLLQLVAHAPHERLADPAVALARREARGERAHVVGDAAQEAELGGVQGGLAGLAQHQQRGAVREPRPGVHVGADRGLAALRKPAAQARGGPQGHERRTSLVRLGRELGGAEGELREARPRQVAAGRAGGVRHHGAHGGAERGGHARAQLLDAGGLEGLVGGEARVQLLGRPVELAGAPLAQLVDRAHDLGGEVLGDGVEQAGVVRARGVRDRPADHEQRDHVRAEAHRHEEEARQRRDAGGLHRAHLVRALDDEVPRGRRPLAQVRARRAREPQVHRPAHPRGEPGEGALEGDRPGDAVRGERPRVAGEQVLLVARDVDEDVGGAHEVVELGGDAGEQVVELGGVQGVEDDVEDAREASVGLGELLDEPLALGGLPRRGVDGAQRQEAGGARGLAARGGARRGRPVEGAHLHDGGPVELEGEPRPLPGRPLPRRVHELADVGADERAAGAAHEALGRLVGHQDAEGGVEGDHAVGRHADEGREGVREVAGVDPLEADGGLVGCHGAPP